MVKGVPVSRAGTWALSLDNYWARVEEFYRSDLRTARASETLPTALGC
jgi:hypothetical protein